MTRFTIRKPSLSLLTFLLLFSLYIAIFLNLAFYRQVLAVFPLTDVRSTLVFLSIPAVTFSVINIVLTAASFFWLERITIAVFILVSATAQYFIQNYGIVLDRSMITNMVDTTPAETFALVTPKMLIVLFFSGVFMAALAFWIRVKKTLPFWRSLAYRGASIAISGVLIILVAALFYKDYASLFRNNKEIIKGLSPVNSIAASLSYYTHHARANLPLVKIGGDARQAPERLNDNKKNLTILVLGETSRAANFSLGGYPRLTNPLLEKDDVSYFRNTTSCGTSTAISVPCMFSNMPRRHFDDELASHQESVLDIIQRAGLNVLWNENDGGCKEVCNRVPHQDINLLKLPGMCIKSECYDDVLFHGLEEYIGQLKGNAIIVIHTIGSHGPTYSHRYPPEFRKFVPTCETSQIQECSQEQLVNTYDNTILYIDHIVDKTIGILKDHQDRFTTSLIYLSDHGESLGENGAYLHGLPYTIAPDVQKKVPMLIWLSPDYQQRYAIDKQCLDKLAATGQFSHDNLFSTLLGITGVSTREYIPSDDVLTSCRGKG